MAESKGSLLAKSVQKHAGRAKEKLLHNLGKVDRTADDIFDDHLTNYTQQQNNALKLQKDFNNYIRSIRSLQTASKSLLDTIAEIYEDQWSGFDVLQAQIAAIDALYQDYSHKLGDQVLIPLNTYTAQFPEMRKKIEKRSRKLIDYDGQRHSFQSLQASANKKKDDVKVSKGREQLEEAKRTYELLNSELHDELPALHDSRILFLVTNLQTLFASEQVFHNETSKVFAELEAIVDKLATDSQRSSYNFKKIPASKPSFTTPSPPQTPTKLNNSSAPQSNNNGYPNVITNGNEAANLESPSSPLNSSPSHTDQTFDNQNTESNTINRNPEDTEIESHSLTINDAKTEPTYQNTTDTIAIDTNLPSSSSATTTPTTAAATITVGSIAVPPASPLAGARAADSSQDASNSIISNSRKDDDNLNNANQIQSSFVDSDSNETFDKRITTTSTKTVIATPSFENGNVKVEDDISKSLNTSSGGNNSNNNQMEQLYDIPLGATTADLPPGTLYRVKATYRYVREDADELSFEVGDIIRVMEYEDPDDQEEGWLTGQKEGTTEKGLFPANFTRPI